MKLFSLKGSKTRYDEFLGNVSDRFPNLPVPFHFSAQITVRDLLLTRFATCWRALFYTLGPVKVVTDDNGEKTAT